MLGTASPAEIYDVSGEEMKMKLYAVALIALIASLACAGDSEEPVRPDSAVIVIENIYSRQGLATNNAISILNRQTIEKLEAFFPKYRDVPSSDMASGWERGYTVYFNFPKGKTLRVIVSFNGDGDTWTMVGGDLKTKGDFKTFVETLQGEKPQQAADYRRCRDVVRA
jgi:hypothetical protein